jgi:hypothetical protein
VKQRTQNQDTTVTEKGVTSISVRNQRSIHFVFLCEALVFGFGILIYTGVIPEWGRWYSGSPHYAAQVNGFLHGTLALSQTPLDSLSDDLVWSEGGVHQVWGLGIPLWRLVWTGLSRLFGYYSFPDHLATGIAFSIVIFVMLQALMTPVVQKATMSQIFMLCGSIFTLVAFPPFLSLLRSRFLVYEEAVAYGYMYALFEFALLVRFLRTSSYNDWLGLMMLAGCGVFVRPTLIFYGFSSWTVGTLVMFSKHHHDSDFALQLIRLLKSRRWVLGSLLFCIGIGTLMFTNWIRFASPFEFGHKLNVQNIYGSLYATRFDHPLQDAPLSVVTKELFGALFFAKPTTNSDLFAKGLFWGQAQLARMRDLDFAVYDWTYIAWLAVAILLLIRSVALRRGFLVEKNTWKIGALWGLLSAAPMFFFYLRVPALCARYLVDFAAAFAVLTVVVWAWINQLKDWKRISGMVLFFAWLSWEITHVTSFGPSRSLIWRETTFKETKGLHKIMPNLGTEIFKSGSSGIRFDGSGWNGSSGAIKCHVIVFVESPRFLEIDLTVASDAVEKPDPHWIRAKIGLEFLEKESIVLTEQGWRVRFRGPHRAQYQNGIQPAFIATVPKERLGQEDTSWLLKRVRWR